MRRAPAALGERAAAAETASETAAETASEIGAEAGSEREIPGHDAPPPGDVPAGHAEEASQAVAQAASEEAVEETAEQAPEAAPIASEEPASEAEAVAAGSLAAIGEAPAGIVSAEPAALAASDEARVEAPALEAALPDPLLPVAVLAADAAEGPAQLAAQLPAGERPGQARAALRFAFAPVRVDIEGISVVLANYVHNESVAAFSYMRALSAARSPAEMIRVNVNEMQRAADASLTCWSDIARRAARGVSLH